MSHLTSRVIPYWSSQPIGRGILPCELLYWYGQRLIAFWPSSSYYVTPLGVYMALNAYLMAINAPLWPSYRNSMESLMVSLRYGHNSQSHWLPRYEPSYFLLSINIQRHTIFGALFFLASWSSSLWEISQTLHLFPSTKGSPFRDSWVSLTLL